MAIINLSQELTQDQLNKLAELHESLNVEISTSILENYFQETLGLLENRNDQASTLVIELTKVALSHQDLITRDLLTLLLTCVVTMERE